MLPIYLSIYPIPLSLSLPSCTPPPGLKVTFQKFPEGLTTGSVPESCLPSPKSSKGKGRSSAQQQPLPAEKRFRFTADELAKIQDQLDEILVHSNGSSKSESVVTTSPHLNTKALFLRLFCLHVLPQAACPAACQPAARCPALAAPRQGAAPGPAASNPGSSSTHLSVRPLARWVALYPQKQTYLRHRRRLHTCMYVSPAPALFIFAQCLICEKWWSFFALQPIFFFTILGMNNEYLFNILQLQCGFYRKKGFAVKHYQYKKGRQDD